MRRKLIPDGSRQEAYMLIEFLAFTLMVAITAIAHAKLESGFFLFIRPN